MTTIKGLVPCSSFIRIVATLAVMSASLVLGQQTASVVRVASPGESAGFAPVWLARDEGIFARNNLKVEFITTIKPVSVLLSGGAEFVLSSGNPPVAAAVAGAEVVILMGIVNRSTFSILTSDKIKQPKDFPGKTVGVSTIGAATDMQIRRALRVWGFNPEKDVAIISTGGQRESLLALHRSQVDAAIVDLFYAITGKVKFGFKEMEGVEGFKDLPSSISSLQPYIRAHREVARRFLQSCMEGIQTFRERKESGIKAIANQLKIQNRQILEEVYNRVASHIEKIPYPQTESVRAILAELAERNPTAKGFQPERIVDPSVLRDVLEAHPLIR